MEVYVVIYRVLALGIVAFWVVQIAIAARQPPEWQPPRADLFPIRVTRNLWLIGGALGIVAGLAVFAFSFVFFS